MKNNRTAQSRAHQCVASHETQGCQHPVQLGHARAMACLRELRADSLLHDVTFAFDDGESRGAHRCVLALHSPVFRSMFDPDGPWGCREVRVPPTAHARTRAAASDLPVRCFDPPTDRAARHPVPAAARPLSRLRRRPRFPPPHGRSICPASRCESSTRSSTTCTRPTTTSCTAPPPHRSSPSPTNTRRPPRGTSAAPATCHICRTRHVAQVEPLKATCEAFLVDKIDAASCVDCLRLSSVYNCPTLGATAHQVPSRALPPPLFNAWQA